jgi:hypothetical protein
MCLLNLLFCSKKRYYFIYKLMWLALSYIEPAFFTEEIDMYGLAKEREL